MANKRMFNIAIVDSDAFLDMPLSSQALYFHLNMKADDDGFVGNSKRIQRFIGASDDDMRILIAKRFVLVFENGVLVVKHWKMNNTIRGDRYTPTVYQDEKNMLEVKQNKSYTLSNLENGNQMATKWQPMVSTVLGLGLDLDIDLDLDKDKDKTLALSVANSQVEIITKDNSYYCVSHQEIDKWQNIYDCDVQKEIMKMAEWCKANPTKRKTVKGMPRFITNWLSRANKEEGLAF